MIQAQTKSELEASGGGSIEIESGSITAQEDILESEEHLTGARLAIVVSIVTTVAFLVFLDSSILVTAIPEITTHFHSIPDIGWYGSAYLLANCSLQPLNGKLYAHFNLKYTFFDFLGIFELGSLLCGVARNSTMFIVGRAVSGLGAAGILNGGLEIITNSTPLNKRPALFGIILGLAQLGTVMGPLIGGALTQYASWRWCFYMNLPAGGVVAAILLAIHIPARARSGEQPQTQPLKQKIALLDLQGAALFATSVTMFLLALNWGGQSYPWKSATVIGLFVGSFADMCVFLAWERKRGDRAMIPLRLLLHRKVFSSCLNMLFIMGNLIVTIYYLPIWFQVVQGTSATMSGVHLLPMILAHILFAIIAGGSVRRFRKYLPFSLASGIFLSVSSGLLTTFKVHTTQGLWIGSQVLIGIGRGCGFQMPLLAIQSSFSPTDSTIGTSLVIFCQYFGGAVFSSVGQTILINSLKESLPKHAPNVNIQALIEHGAAGVRNAVVSTDLPGVLTSYNRALTDVFYLATAVAIAGFISCSGMGWKGMKKSTSA